MCGFIIGKNLKHNLEDIIEDIDYRGIPGYKGYAKYHGIQLAHYSLPIVNLDKDFAIQPVYSQSRIPSVFAGEIFNYKELGRFETDSLCITDKYHEVGLDSFHVLDGFWSFATVSAGQIFAITDYLAQKPVYYRTDIDVVASEIDILKQFGPCTPDKLFLSNVAKWGYDPTPNTPWNEIKQIPPGHYYYNKKIYKYWDWDKVPITDLETDLKKATKLRMGGQRKVAVLLSGGLDSSIIYGLLKELNINPLTIHVDNSEENYARLVDPNPTTILLDNISDEEALKVHQTPVDLGSVKPQIAMARKLKELDFNVVMTGDGADELFGGYRRAKEYDSQYSDIFCELPYYHCPKLDRTMMKYTVELRTPYLSPAVVKHALNIPYEKRKGIKQVLKDKFGYLVPKEILDRDKLPLKTKEIHSDPISKRMDNLKLWKEMNGLAL